MKRDGSFEAFVELVIGLILYLLPFVLIPADHVSYTPTPDWPWCGGCVALSEWEDEKGTYMIPYFPSGAKIRAPVAGKVTAVVEDKIREYHRVFFYIEARDSKRYVIEVIVYKPANPLKIWVRTGSRVHRASLLTEVPQEESGRSGCYVEDKNKWERCEGER